MGKMRVYEYAKQQNITSKEVIHTLKEMNINVANHMSMIDSNTIEKLNGRYQKEQPKKNVQKDHQPKQKEEKHAAYDDIPFDDDEDIVLNKKNQAKNLLQNARNANKTFRFNKRNIKTKKWKEKQKSGSK